MATIKQKEAFDKMVGNGGNVTQAMRDAKYSEATINTPQKLTESKGFIELMEEHIPNILLAEKHKALLNKADAEGNIDVQAVKAGLDMAYKLKGAYEEGSKPQTVVFPILVQYLNGKETDNSRNTD